MELFSGSESDDDNRSSSSSCASEARADIIEQHSDDDDGQLRINADYAARFQHNKERTELHRLQEKHDDKGDSESSDDETEDEDGEQMTADVDAAILSTLAKIRRKDESIYETGKRVFEEERLHASKSKLLPSRKLVTAANDGKKITLGEYQRRRIQHLLKTSDDPARELADATMIERRTDGRTFDDEDEHATFGVPKSHNKEQEELRRSVTSAFHNAADDEQGDGDFFTSTQRAISPDGVAANDEYRTYLVDILGGKEDDLRQILRAQADDAALDDASAAHAERYAEERRRKNVSIHPTGREEENEEFLTNYILNRGWMDNPNAAPQGRHDGEADAASEDSFDSRADAFEEAFNHRFQEMEEGHIDPQIQSYARRIEGSARRTENKRKREREERTKRKDEERASKRQELDRLRDLKRNTIVDRLKALKEATGSASIDFGSLDLQADFDPDEHDRLMAQAFDDTYYEGQDEEGQGAQKPTWDDDVNIDDILREHEEREAVRRPSKERKRGKAERTAEGAREDVDTMDDSEKKLSKAEKKKLKKREKAKARKAQEEEHGKQHDDSDNERDGVGEDEMDADVPLKKSESSFAGENMDDVASMSQRERKRKMEEMMNEYYGLEYEDMIGDQPTRFKYTEVPKSDFGLTPVEILLADDTELNKIVGLKRLQPYSRSGRMGSQRGPADLKARLKDFRQSFYKGDNKRWSDENGGPSTTEKPKKAGKRERERKKAAKTAAIAAAAATIEEESVAAERTRRVSQNSNA